MPEATLLPPHARLSILHKGRLQSYQKWCRIWGVLRAIALGATGIDIDVLLDKNGNWIATHWPRPLLHLFRVLKGAPGIPRRTVIAAMDLAQIASLRSIAPDSVGAHIVTVKRLMLAAKGAITLCLEVKVVEKRFQNPATYDPLIEDAARTESRILIMVMHRAGLTKKARDRHEAAAYACARAAHSKGLFVMLLTRGVVDAKWATVISAAKGPKRHMANLPASVRRYGAGSVHGMSCGPTKTSIASVNRSIARNAAKATPKTGADKIVAIAKAEVGYHEGRDKSGNWNNRQKYAPAVPGLEWAQNQAWCATFVAWCALQAGYAALYPRTASCDVGWAWFKDRGQISEYPVVGAQVFFGTPGDKKHTGLVVAYDADTITTVEGNTNDSGSPQGDGVYQLRHRRRDDWVQGYGVPKFPAS